MEAATDPSPLSLDKDSRSSMTKLQHSVLSHFLNSNPSLSINTDHASSHIQQRLKQFFPSIRIPSHLPYSLMIENALKGLDERNGSTEDAISDFIEKEYKDLPLAHSRVLRDRLEKLCESGELVCKEGGRYVFVVDDVGVGGINDDDDGNGAESKGRTKRKREENKNNDGKREKKGRIMERFDGVERDNGLEEEGIKEHNQVPESRDARTDDEPIRAVNECIEEHVEEEENHLFDKLEEQEQAEKGVFEKQSQSECQATGVKEQHAEAEAPAHSEGEKSQVSQIQDSIMHLETICSSQRTAPNLPVDSQQPLLVPISEGLPKGIPSAGIEQGENALSGDPEQRPPKRPQGRPRKPEITAYQRKMLQAEDKAQQCGQGRGRGRGRGKGKGRGRPPKEQGKAKKGLFEVVGKQSLSECQETGVIEPHAEAKVEAPAQSEGEKSQVSQIQDSIMLLETICSSQRTAPNLQVDSQQRLLVPILEGLPKGIPSEGIEQGENPLSGDPEQKPPKRPQGRPRKPEITAYQHKKPLQAEDKAQQCGQGSGRGSGRGRGRPRKLSHNTDQCEEQLQQADPAQQHGSGSSSGRGRGRGSGSGKGRGRPRKLDRNANQSEEQLPPQDQAPSLLELLPHVEQGRWQTCERLSMESALNSLSDANQTLRKLQPERQNQDLGQDMPPNPMMDAIL